MTENILDPVQPDSQQIDPNKNYLEELVGEGKKFKSPQELARGKYESDLYIRTLERQKDELRNDYLKLREDITARATLEEIIDKMGTSKQQQASSEIPPANDVNQPVYDPKQIENLVASKIQEHDLSKKQQDNLNMVRTKLQEQYGVHFSTVVKQQIADLGITEDFFNDLARKHPQVLFKTLGFDQQNQRESFQAPPRSEKRNDNFAPTTQKRTWAYYQEMKKNDPKRYLDPKTTVQIVEDYKSLGKDFEDGNFHN